MGFDASIFIIIVGLSTVIFGAPDSNAETSENVSPPSKPSFEKLITFGQSLASLLEERCPRVDLKHIHSALESFSELVQSNSSEPSTSDNDNDELSKLIQSISECPSAIARMQPQATTTQSVDEEVMDVSEEAPVEQRERKKHKLPIIRWIKRGFSAVKSFFLNLFIPDKTIEKRSLPADPSPENGEHKSVMHKILHTFNVSAEGRNRGRKALINAMRIYGHTCPTSEAHAQAFENLAKDILGWLDNSDLLSMYVRTYLDEDLLNELANCLAITLNK